MEWLSVIEDANPLEPYAPVGAGAHKSAASPYWKSHKKRNDFVRK